MKHKISRYLLELTSVYLGNDEKQFKFQRPKKVINAFNICDVIDYVEGKSCSVSPIRNLLHGIALADEHSRGIN